VNFVSKYSLIHSALYKRLVGFVSKYSLIYIAEEFDRVRHLYFDS